ncbi:MAG: DUF1800 domain-containing protein [Pseudomonadota bacterium]|nr:DUF1800 domain-containing protein [Pseudomonadota bacterium]
MPNHHLAPPVTLPLLPNRSTVLAGLLVALLLAGCGGGGSSSTSSAASASGAGSSPATGTTPTPAAPITDTAAIRFLEQATFGPTSADITHLQAIGYDAWLTEQFATATSDFPNITDASSLDAVQAAFFRNAVTAPDQLRQRIAFALGQIFVVSNQKIDTRVGIAAFQRMLLADSFGTYRNVLKDVTVSPAMGNYLDMANNVKADPVAGTSPNENYGREVLQLFSVGVNQLNADGSVRVDAAKKPMPTYGQDTVEGFARAFSGWTYPTKAGAAPQDTNDEN